MKKLYKVELTYTIMVVAEEKDAIWEATQNVSCESPEETNVENVISKDMLGDWVGCYPYGDSGRKMCEEYLDVK
jgi:hypothetical protein